MLTRERIGYIDYLRAIAACYIVGFWHLLNYSKFDHGTANGLTFRLVVLSLGTFVFVSGYLLGKTPVIQNRRQLLEFYKRRFLRIYPLFLLAVGLFAVTKSADKHALISAVFASSVFTSLHLTTLWFICALVVFYAVAPLLINATENALKFATVAAIVMGIFAILQSPLEVPDRRLLIYFPAFALGIFYANRAPQRPEIAAIVAASIAAIAISLTDRSASIEHSLLSTPLAALAPLAIVIACKKLDLLNRPSAAVMAISYASFVMYLIHRPLYSKLARLVHDGPPRILFLIFVLFPLVAVASWLIQRAYDRLILRAFRPGARVATAGQSPAPADAGRCSQPQ
jgi:peptidoglycan/LPS O-acetylase OafA/YrhL